MRGRIDEPARTESDGELLIVEPSKIVAHGIARSVGELGIRSIEFSALSSVLAYVETAMPVAVVAAHELNGMPAESLYAALRASPSHRAIPFAMITGSDLPEEPGCVPVFQKTPALGGTISKWLGSIGVCREVGPGRTLAGARLLVAEDTASMRRLLSHKLHLRGASVTLAEDGVEAGVLGLRSPFDLIVLDIEMPRLDGRDAARIFRDAGVSCPIVALTAHDDPLTISSLLSECGFESVIAKSEAVTQLEEFWLARGGVAGEPAA